MTEINIGQLAEAINDKMDRDANNIQSPRLPVFLVAKQDPTNNNNYTWYRKYTDGWVEQGGIFSNVPTVAITFPITMSDTNYIINIQWNGGKNEYFYSNDQFINNISTTGFRTNGQTNSNVKQRNWEVKGMAAQ